ncbi:MAG: hypothetical protein CME64_18125 [Halobacteriovoraceae bacterium]|nr:hypothetical protein [Halobacteriovoraceae bacterium]|tara:strand:+ start:40350 stop:40883 length:534 start_codon:yes stop_codon:yes gene_type:complete
MKKNLLILLFFAMIANSKAGLLIEPYAGAALSGSWENGAADGDYSGSTIGARLGFQQLGLFGGLDFRKSSFTVEEDGQSDEDLDATTYAAVLGYDFPILVRVWGEYIFGGEAELDSLDYKEPSGTVLGIGYTGLPFLSVNFEMVSWKYDEYDAGVISGDTDLEGNHYLLSISLPLNL